MLTRKTHPRSAKVKATAAAVKQRSATPTPTLPPPRPRRSNSRFAAGTPSRTHTPDVIPETPPTAATFKEMQSQLKQLQKVLNRRGSSSSRARSRRSRSGSSGRRREGSITASDTGSDEKRAAFGGFEGKKPYRSLHDRFPFVERRHFKEIFHGTFRTEHLVKLAETAISRVSESQEATDIVHLLRCFGVYTQAVLHYTSDHRLRPLVEAFGTYTAWLQDMSVQYRFDSIRDYHHAFVRTRILLAQDDAAAWATLDQDIMHLLVRKQPPPNAQSISRRRGPNMARARTGKRRSRCVL